MRALKTTIPTGIVLGLALPVIATGASTANTAPHIQNLASLSYPLSPGCFRKPTFTPSFPETTLSRSFDFGNWHYEIHYRYEPQKHDWVIVKSDARRLHLAKIVPSSASAAAAQVAAIEAKICPVNSLPLDR